MLDHSISATIMKIHEGLRENFPSICRIAVAIYDSSNDSLKTFAHSTDGKSPLCFYEAKLSEIPSLHQIASSGVPRVLNDLTLLRGSPREHSQKVIAAGYQSSYTEPMLLDGQLVGFLFFDATVGDYFEPDLVAELTSYAKMLTAIIAVQFTNIRTLNGAVVVAREFSRYRDEETANHLQRMSRYARLIAIKVAPRFGLDDEDVEFIQRFAQLHDIGKIAISDTILLKPGKLTAEQYAEVQQHVERGLEMAQLMISEFGLDSMRHAEMMLAIIHCHHERYDGTGYPRGLAGENIPVVGRIVAVADVYDALTSERPYKRPWTSQDAFGYLFHQAGTQFDPHCVEAALQSQQEFEQIRRSYSDDPAAEAASRGLRMDRLVASGFPSSAAG